MKICWFALALGLGFGFAAPPVRAQEAPVAAEVDEAASLPPAPDEFQGGAVMPAALTALLPPAQRVVGASVRVIDAGFRAYPLFVSAASSRSPSFYLVTESTPGAQLRLLDIIGPDLQRATYFPLAARTSEGRFARLWPAPYVDPRWERVRVRFEVTAPGAPAAAHGSFAQEFPVELPIPQLGETTPLGISVTTERGTKVEIADIATKKPEMNGNGDRLSNVEGTVTLNMSGQKPADVPDAKIDFSLGNYRIDGEEWHPQNSGASRNADKMIARLQRPPARVKSLQATLTVSESAPQWVLSAYSGVVEFELPVAALLQARPPARLSVLPKLFEAQTEDASARLSAPLWKDGQWQMRVWSEMRPLAGAPEDNSNLATRLVISKITSKNAQGGEFNWNGIGADGSGNLFFAPDDAALARDQSAQTVALWAQRETDEPVQISATAQERRFYSSQHEFRGLPIPPRGQTLELNEKWSDESALIRRIGWTKRGQLAIVCENISLWNGKFDASAAATSNGTHSLQLITQSNNDPLRDDARLKPGSFALLFETPLPGAETLDLVYGATETDAGAERTFRWDLRQ